jgi:hypothetical protein
LNFGGLSPSLAKARLNRGQTVKTGKQLSAESILHFAWFLSRLKNLRSTDARKSKSI